MANLYAIRSVSEDGTYFLTSSWKRTGNFFKPFIAEGMTTFKSAGLASNQLRRLLKAMPYDYLADKFTMLELDPETHTAYELYDIDIWTVHTGKANHSAGRH